MHLNWWLQVIAAEGEQKASRALKEASEVIAQSSSALQLRYLQVTIWKNIQKLLFLKYFSFFLDTQLHIGREELYHYFPPPNRLHNTFPQGQARKRGESWLKCSRQRVDLKKKGEKKNLQGFFYEMLLPNFSDSLYFGVGHYDSKKHEFQLPSSFLPTILVRRNYA